MATNDVYSAFIAKSRYARYLEDEKRRETFGETVDRYFGFMGAHLEKTGRSDALPADLFGELRGAVLGLEVAPSMRALMTAGGALERTNVAGYNCAYVPLDDPKSFDEAMYVLLCGTGVGFSAESKYVSKLPEVPDKLFDAETTIVVHDSKEGWAKALRQLIALLYTGEVPKVDYSKVRLAGSRLRTFGGRASGPEPLRDLFRFVVAKFRKAVGRKLSTIEAHDIACKIGEVVVVGGVRRSAMISLSDLSDDKIAHAKSGNWWESHGHRALANNSAVYAEKPVIGAFMREWYTIYSSRSGERGIFNRQASARHAASNGRRATKGVEFGTNPCCEIILRPYQFCNLTSAIVRADDDMPALERKIRLAAALGTIQATLTDFPYLRKVWKKNTEEEALLGVSMTGALDNPLLNDPEDPGLPARLERLRAVAVDANAEFAEALGINRAAAVTCVKPEGTLSQLANTSSGLHPNHAPHYVRRVRGDNKDPLTRYLVAAGVPSEPCVMKPEATTVFSFPRKAPEGALVRSDLDALKHLKLWLLYQRHYTEHKPSVTVTLKDEEWMSAGAFVYENFDEMTGVSFLPESGTSYRQMPYEDITEAEYDIMVSSFPKDLDFSFEEDVDNTTGTQTLACTAGGCEL
jgi:ribonucleoside-diphosphate reductase alpha chain